MREIGRDLLYALRILRKTPRFTIIAVLTLALGIGANTALFSIINGVLLNPLPYPHSEQLVRVYARTAGVDQGPVVYLNFLDWRRENRSFASMAIYRNQDYNFTGATQAERLTGYMISADFFSTLGVQPVAGRMFQSEDDRIGAAPVVVLGGSFWNREFGGSRDAVGKSITLNGTSYQIVGVVPSSFSFYGQDRDVYTPIGQWNDPYFLDRRISVSAHSIGRLKPGIALGQARADMDIVARHLAEEFPVADKDAGVALVSMKQDQVGNVAPLLLLLLAAVGFLLLIACANVANLLLARAIGRSREFAIRASLGAGRGRVFRQLLTESLLLAGFGGALGLAIARGATTAVVNALPGTLPRTEEITLAGRVLLFSMAITLLAAIVFGLVPALRSSRVSLQEVLQQSSRGAGGARARVQRIFVASEVAMALVLLIGAGLMLRSVSALWRVNPGYNPSHAITFSLSMPSSETTTAAETRARLREFDREMLSIRGVQAESVTLGSRPMIHDSSLPFWIEGRPKPANDNEMPQSMFYLVEEGFAPAMGITLERGRFISARDSESAPVVIDIDDVFAHQYFPGEDPIGKRVHLTQFNLQAEIVGVVGHIKQWGPVPDANSAIEAQFFYPFMQLPEQLMAHTASGVAVVLRTAGDPAAILQQVRAAVEKIDSRDVIYAVQTMDGVIAGSLATRRLSMVLLSVFAGLALLLACIGIYGVIAYVVGQRTHEIGVRMALGAQRGDVMRLILGEGAKMALAGVICGIAGAFGMTRLMSNQLFGISAHDPLTFAGVAILLAMVALVACYVPARRATRVNPVVALRCE